MLSFSVKTHVSKPEHARGLRHRQQPLWGLDQKDAIIYGPGDAKTTKHRASFSSRPTATEAGPFFSSTTVSWRKHSHQCGKQCKCTCEPHNSSQEQASSLCEGFCFAHAQGARSHAQLLARSNNENHLARGASFPDKKGAMRTFTFCWWGRHSPTLQRHHTSPQPKNSGDRHDDAHVRCPSVNRPNERAPQTSLFAQHGRSAQGRCRGADRHGQHKVGDGAGGGEQEEGSDRGNQQKHHWSKGVRKG